MSYVYVCVGRDNDVIFSRCEQITILDCDANMNILLKL